MAKKRSREGAGSRSEKRCSALLAPHRHAGWKQKWSPSVCKTSNFSSAGPAGLEPTFSRGPGPAAPTQGALPSSRSGNLESQGRAAGDLLGAACTPSGADPSCEESCEASRTMSGLLTHRPLVWGQNGVSMSGRSPCQARSPAAKGTEAVDRPSATPGPPRIPRSPQDRQPREQRGVIPLQGRIFAANGQAPQTPTPRKAAAAEGPEQNRDPGGPSLLEHQLQVGPLRADLRPTQPRLHCAPTHRLHTCFVSVLPLLPGWQGTVCLCAEITWGNVVEFGVPTRLDNRD